MQPAVNSATPSTSIFKAFACIVRPFREIGETRKQFRSNLTNIRERARSREP
jgi:hypothetical protein